MNQNIFTIYFFFEKIVSKKIGQRRSIEKSFAEQNLKLEIKKRFLFSRMTISNKAISLWILAITVHNMGLVQK